MRLTSTRLLIAASRPPAGGTDSVVDAGAAALGAGVEYDRFDRVDAGIEIDLAVEDDVPLPRRVDVARIAGQHVVLAETSALRCPAASFTLTTMAARLE